MTKLMFEGAVDWLADPTDDNNACTITIGGRDVLYEIEEAFGGHCKVTVAIADATFTGDLYVDLGSRAYSELTPGDIAELTTGPHNLFSELYRHDGQVITMWIADEPVDLGADE